MAGEFERRALEVVRLRQQPLQRRELVHQVWEAVLYNKLDVLGRIVGDVPSQSTFLARESVLPQEFLY